MHSDLTNFFLTGTRHGHNCTCGWQNPFPVFQLPGKDTFLAKSFRATQCHSVDKDDDHAWREDDYDVCEKEEEGKTMRASSSFLRVLCVFSVWLLLLQITMVEGKDV